MLSVQDQSQQSEWIIILQIRNWQEIAILRDIGVCLKHPLTTCWQTKQEISHYILHSCTSDLQLHKSTHTYVVENVYIAVIPISWIHTWLVSSVCL